MKTERLKFPGSSGLELAARIDRPVREPQAWALFAHCFTCSKDLRAAKWISEGLVRRGVAVLRFDFTGLGESEGDFADTNFSSNLEDLVAAADFMRRRGQAPRLLIGHSLGGAAVLAAASRIPESTAVATIAAPSEPGHLTQTLIRSSPELEAREEAEVHLGGRTFTIRKQLLEDLDSHRLDSALASLGRALLIFHAPEDDLVGIDHASRIYKAARHPKSFVSLAGADHLLTRERDAKYVAEVLSAWAGRYVESGPAPTEEAARGEVVVRAGGSGYAQEIVAGPHELPADEPIPIGADTGPTPYDLLLAGLGACTSMTLRMYAERKKLPLEGLEVRLSHSRIHAEDCADCETAEGKVDNIELTLRPEGPLDESQRSRLLEIAGRCPVHRTLTTETKIRSRLEE